METQNHMITSRLVLIDELDRLVLPIRPIDANKRGGELDFFGGQVDPGECPRFAAVRESREEGKLEVDESEIEKLYEQTDYDGDLRIDRLYYVLKQRVSVGQIKELTEHMALACLFQKTAMKKVVYIPHQRAISELEQL